MGIRLEAGDEMTTVTASVNGNRGLKQLLLKGKVTMSSMLTVCRAQSQHPGSITL